MIPSVTATESFCLKCSWKHSVAGGHCQCVEAYGCFIRNHLFNLQSASEKHKINVPETMNEYLDMSDDEGRASVIPNVLPMLCVIQCQVH